MISPASAFGGSASQSARAGACDEPPPSARNAASAVRVSTASSAGATSSAAALANSSTPTSARSWPVITASCTNGASADTTFSLKVPTDTQVPDESLKSSATRPLKATPASGRCGSTRKPASPMR